MSGAEEFSVSDDAKALVDEIIAKKNLGPDLEIRYYPGTDAGDGYSSKHVGVEIRRPQGNIKLFIKYALDLKIGSDVSVEKFYGNEIYFYDILFPAYRRFLTEKGIQDGFQHVPKCWGTSLKNIIALEDIRDKEFTLFDRRTIMDDNHITLVLKTFAKFHAVSFAFKDQDREGYDRLIAAWDGDMAKTVANISSIRKMWVDIIQEGLNALDPVKDEQILERCDAESLGNLIMDIYQQQNEYSIFTQGDCWCNNMMFKYENGDRNKPIDIMLVDWQLLRPLSPAVDISYFFYTIASEESLAKLDAYLEMYYEELSNQLKPIGSDINKIYPKAVFQKEWKRYCRYGFGMAFMLIKMMVANREEVPKMDEFDFVSGEKVQLFSKLDNEAEFVRRLRTLAQFMVDRDYV